jgi:hypothetical protein
MSVKQDVKELTKDFLLMGRIDQLSILALVKMRADRSLNALASGLGSVKDQRSAFNTRIPVKND